MATGGVPVFSSGGIEIQESVHYRWVYALKELSHEIEMSCWWYEKIELYL
jgi:hypothetical protein